VHRRFERSGMRGYKAADVDKFMAEASTIFSQLSRENIELKTKVDELQAMLDEYDQTHESLSQVLLNAQRLADTIIKDANVKADLTIRDAQIKAEKTVEKAKAAILEQQKEYLRLQNEVISFKASVMDLYREHLKLIDELPVDDEQTAEEPAGDQPDAAQEEETSETAEVSEAEEEAAAAQIEPAEDVISGEQENAEPETEAEAKEPSAADDGGQEDEDAGEQVDEDTGGQNEAQDADEDVPAVKLNLQFDENSGEYIPLGQNREKDDYDGLKFGSDYDLSKDQS
jgi:cell division initiation protein